MTNYHNSFNKVAVAIKTNIDLITFQNVKVPRFNLKWYALERVIALSKRWCYKLSYDKMLKLRKGIQRLGVKVPKF